MDGLASIIVGIWFLPALLFIGIPLSVATIYLVWSTARKLFGFSRVESRQSRVALS